MTRSSSNQLSRSEIILLRGMAVWEKMDNGRSIPFRKLIDLHNDILESMKATDRAIHSMWTIQNLIRRFERMGLLERFPGGYPREKRYWFRLTPKAYELLGGKDDLHTRTE